MNEFSNSPEEVITPEGKGGENLKLGFDEGKMVRLQDFTTLNLKMADAKQT